MDSRIIDNLNFIQLNTDFSKASTLLIEKHMHEFNIDAALLQDIHCEKFGLDQKYKPPDFIEFNSFYYRDNTNTIPKAALYIKKGIQVTLLAQASNHHCITCMIHLDNSNFVIISSIYSPPPDNSPTLRTDHLFNSLTKIQVEKLVMCGDFNSHSSLWSNEAKNDRKGNELEIVLLQNDLTVLNSVTSPPTFENTQGGKSWIDISTAGSQIADNVINWRVRNDESLSFHKIITFSLNLSPSINNQVRYNFERTNWPLFNQKLSENFLCKNISVERVSSVPMTELDILAESISVVIKDTIISHVPSTENYKKRLLVSWWNKEISSLRKSVNNARRKKQKQLTPQNIDSYRNLRNKYKNAIRKSKHDDFSNFCSTAESPWELLRKLTSRPQNSCTPVLLKDDRTFTINDQDTCTFLLKKWFPDDDANEDQNVHAQTRQYVNQYLSRPVTPIPDITDTEMDIIHTISPMKLPGWDLIRAIVLQNLTFANRDIIKSLFNQCVKYSLFPHVWQFGIGQISPKPDKNDETNYKSYRCITLLSVLGKWFEKIIMKRLMWTALKNKLLSEKQFGFIPGRSCEDAICNITSLIENAFYNKRYVLIIFLDISGAFDCTWHPSVLKSFITKGYEPAYVHLISSYLSHRLVRLNINNSSSSKYLSRSCPQGGGLSPFIWDTDYDDTLGIPAIDPNVLAIIEESTYIDSSSQAYADDSQVAIVSDTLHSCQLIANDILSKLHDHSISKKMNYSAEKTKAVIFTRQKISHPLDLQLNGKQIEISESAKLLGVTLDSRLTWKPHIENQVTKSKRLLFLLNKCCKLKWGLKSKALHQVWSGVIEPILLYGSPAWASCVPSKWLQSKLESVQRLAAIKIIRGFKCVSYEASITISGLTPIMSRLHEKCLVYAAKHPDHFNSNIESISHVSVINNIANCYNIDLFNYQIPNKKPLEIPPYHQITPNTSLQPSQIYPLRENNYINIYTDGSKSPLGTGCAFVIFPPYPYVIDHQQQKILSVNSVFQAELLAIRLGLKYLLSLSAKLVSSCSINFFTDSQSSINAISDINTANPLVREIQKFLRFYNTITKVNFFWCKGHNNTIGNEMADYFARQSVFLTQTDHTCKAPLSHIKSTIRSQSKTNWLSRWQQSEKGRDTFGFIPTVPPEHFLSKQSNHKITQILTGHCRLNMYLNYIGVKEDPACLCEDYLETVDHYLFVCRLEANNRTNTLIQTCFNLGIDFPPSKTLLVDNKILFHSLCSFLAASTRLDFDN